MKVIKKITAKEVCGDVKKLVNLNMKDGELPEGLAIPLMRVVGKCDRTQIKTTDIGESLLLLGNFEGINIATGEVFRSGRCYLPEVAADMIAGMLLDDSVSAVEFGFDIGVITDPSSIVGYTWEVTPLVEPQDDDALSRLSKSLPALPKLPAPEKKK